MIPDVRLIDANALKLKMTVSSLGGHKRYWVCGVIDDATTIDAQPVKRGKWVKYPSIYRCSNCGNPKGTPKPYCELCGARMEVDEDETP